MGIVDNIRRVVAEKGLKYSFITHELGIHHSYFNDVAKGKTKIPDDRLKIIADLLDTTPEYLRGETDIKEKPESTTHPVRRRKGVKVPVYGAVPAGVPLEAIEDIIDHEEITPEMAARGEYMALKIKGDSMTPFLISGDIAIVRVQDDADSEDIVIAIINGEDSTCKKLRKEPKGIWLLPLNPAFEPMFFSNKQAIELPVRILGVVVEVRRTLKR